MNIDYLKNYIVIVESNNISDASKKLFIAQPSLSNQIKYLEEQYGCKLIHRSGRVIKLTKGGKILYEKSKQIIKAYNESFVEIQNLKHKSGGILNIAIPPTVYKELIDKNFLEFSKKHPDVALNIYEANASNAQEYLDNDICEIAITNANISNIEKYNVKELAKESFKVFLPIDSPLNQKDELHITDLKNLHFAIPRAYISNIYEHASLYKIDLKIDVITTTTRGALEISKLKNIAAIVPLPEDENLNANCKLLKLDDFNVYTRKLIWKKETELSLISKEFIECIEEIFN